MKNKIILSIVFILSSYLVSAQIVYDENYKKRLDEEYATGLFKGTLNAYMVVPGDDPSATTAFTIFQYLQGRIPGLIINNTKLFSPTVYWRMNSTAFFLDEMRVDASALATINMDDVALIKVFRPPFIGAVGNGPGGAIAVYTLKGDDEEDGE